jgi:hypothetical protein
MNEPIFNPNEDKKVNGITNIAKPLSCRNDLLSSIAKITIAAQAIAATPPIRIFLIVLLMFFKFGPLIWFFFD